MIVKQVRTFVRCWW